MSRASSPSALVGRAFDAFSRRDLEALLALCDPDVELCPGAAQLTGHAEPYRGYEGLRTHLAEVARLWQELRWEPDELVEVGETVVCTGRVYAWGVGRVIDAPAGWVWRVRDGRVVYGRAYESRREALEAVGIAG